MALTKTELVETIHARVGFSKSKSFKVTDLILDLMKESLVRGERVMISGFGNFEVREKAPRRGRNPQTGEGLALDGRRVLTFKPSTVLKERLKMVGSRGAR